jgi:small-conductance mechanosensitive channel
MEKRTLKEFLDISILNIESKFNLTVSIVIELLILFAVSWLLIFIIKKAIYKSKRLDIGKKFSLSNLIKYAIYIISFAIFLSILGTDLKFVLAGSAALLVGIGLGLQNLFSDFVSGIIILMDSSIKVGDILDVDGLICKVEKINIRTTLVLTRDDKFILLPNTLLTKNKIVNWTHTDNKSRFDVKVGVAYSSDLDLTMKVIKEACKEHKGVLKDPEPFVRLTDFGSYSLEFVVYFWVDNVYRAENVKSEVRINIFKKFKQNNITIPFPQHVLHTEKEWN